MRIHQFTSMYDFLPVVIKTYRAQLPSITLVTLSVSLVRNSEALRNTDVCTKLVVML